MKGHTKIILTNVETGEQEIHEDDNLITNALDKIINIEMAMNHAPNTRILPIATNALGGIMLFDGALTEDADNIHFPSEAHLVGYANQSLNTDDKFRGSYNAIESGKTPTGFTSVWDFGTTQANGTIKAVARTSNHGGACPIYNYMGPASEATGGGFPTNDQSWMPIRYDGEYLYMLKGDSNSHVMRMARVKIPVLRMGAADYSDVGRTYEIVAAWSTEVTSYTYWNNASHQIEYTQYVYADDPFDYEDGGDGYIYCMFYGAGTLRTYNEYSYDITYFTINYGDGSFDKSETVRLTTGLGYYAPSSENYLYRAYRYGGHVHNGVLYRLRGGRKIIDIIPLSNVAAYRSIRIVADSSPDYVYSLEYIHSRSGCIYFQVYHYTTTSYQYLQGILYPDGIFLVLEKSYAGTNASHGENYTYTTYCKTCDDDLTIWGGPYPWSPYGPLRNWAANYLGTINNLPSEITKTAAQTMKIVYTLTDVDEDDSEDEEENSGE